jgi:hypothetical protein
MSTTKAAAAALQQPEHKASSKEQAAQRCSKHCQRPSIDRKQPQVCAAGRHVRCANRAAHAHPYQLLVPKATNPQGSGASAVLSRHKQEPPLAMHSAGTQTTPDAAINTCVAQRDPVPDAAAHHKDTPKQAGLQLAPVNWHTSHITHTHTSHTHN